MRELINAQKVAAEMALNGRAAVRLGLVSSYDPSNYAIKVRIQPEDTETGWLPIGSPWVGNGWGMFCPPAIGNMLELQFQEDDIDAALVGWNFYNDSDRPLNVPSGEFWLVHQSGSYLKFTNDGSVTVNANANMTLQAPNGTLRLSGQNVQIHASLAYSWDSGGFGEKWTCNGSPNWTHKTWQTGASITTIAASIAPPEGS